MIKIKFNCKFINGKVRNMELPILLKEKLEQENIFISRRTIQKYREQCQIPKASLRRKKR